MIRFIYIVVGFDSGQWGFCKSFTAFYVVLHRYKPFPKLFLLVKQLDRFQNN